LRIVTFIKPSFEKEAY